MKRRSIIIGALVGVALLVSPAVVYGKECAAVIPPDAASEGAGGVVLMGSGLGASERIVDDIVRAAEKTSARIDFGYLPEVDEVRRAINWVGEHRGDLLLNPEGCTIWAVGDDAHFVELRYLGSNEDIPRMRAEAKEAIGEALSWVSSTADEAERAKALHDYIIRNCSYDYFNYKNGTIPEESYNTYGVLCCSKGVCTGYSRAFSTLLYYAGIDSTVVSSGQMNHAWTLVRIDGDWFNCDLTFDDPVSFQTGMDGGFFDAVEDNYFLKSDAYITDHYGKESPVTCISSRFDSTKWDSYDRPHSLVRFSDVDPQAWYVDSMAWAVEEGALNGSGRELKPSAVMTRAEAATMLWNMFGDDIAPSTSAPMFDVPQGQWYSEAVSWAVDSGIIIGYGNGKFGPSDPLTREQFCVIVERLADNGIIYPIVYDDRYFALRDVALISEWARYPVLVEFAQGIINGDGCYLRPRDALTRSEAATILRNAIDRGFVNP